jgi:hypothetical protein
MDKNLFEGREEGGGGFFRLAKQLQADGAIISSSSCQKLAFWALCARYLSRGML